MFDFRAFAFSVPNNLVEFGPLLLRPILAGADLGEGGGGELGG